MWYSQKLYESKIKNNFTLLWMNVLYREEYVENFCKLKMITDLNSDLKKKNRL